MTGSSPPQARWRRLPPDPESAGDARRFVASVLTGVDGDLLDTVQLLTSELVTNAVLHAGTELEVGVWAASDRVHVSVFDQAPAARIVRREDDIEAATGRGLQMVEVLASAYGTDTAPGGKTVWFELWPGLATETTCRWDTQDAFSDPVAGIFLGGVPVGLCRAAKRHRRALLREGRLALMRADSPTGVTSEQLAAATNLSDMVDFGIETRLAEVGPDEAVFDCVLYLPVTSKPAVAVLASTLDALDGAARSGAMLTRPALPEIRRFRTWLIDQISSQIDDPAAASSWAAQSGGVDTYDGASPGGSAVDWEIHSERSDTAIVAADDDNRIVDINARAAELLGWERHQLRGARLTTLVPDAWRDRHVAGFTEFLLTGRSGIVGEPTRLPVLRRDGTTVEATVLITVEQSRQGRTVFVAGLTPTG